MRKQSSRSKLIPTITLLVGMLAVSEFAQAQGPGAAPVVVAPVVEQSVSATNVLVGTITPLRTSVVGSAVDGRVLDFLVNEGDPVKAGQPLAQIRTGTIAIDLERARAEADLRRAELEEMENGTRPEEITQFAARMKSAQATMDYLTSRFRRNESLYQRSQSVTEDELDRSRSAMIEAQQAFADAKAAHALAVEGPRKEKVEQARAQLHVQEESVRFIEDRLKKYTVRAPFDGYVVTEGTEQGQWIKEAEVVAEVAELARVEVKFFVPEEFISRVKLGMKVKLTLEAFPGEDFQGTVARIIPQADTRSRTFPVKVVVENTITEGVPKLKSGMLARVHVGVGQQQNALIVPKDALVLGGPQPMVQVVDVKSGTKQGAARAVPVHTGLAHGTWIQVSGNLKAGEQVVIRGNERLQPGQIVKIVDAASAPK